MQVRFYVDGLNLYYRAIQGTKHKWLDIVALAEKLLPGNSRLDEIKYFTSRVSGARDPDAPRRQNTYLAALKRSGVSIHYGKMIKTAVMGPLISLPIADEQIDTPTPVSLPAGRHVVRSPEGEILTIRKREIIPAYDRIKRKPPSNAVFAEVQKIQEKASDVNLASHLLFDTLKGETESVVVVSNDSDLAVPVRMVRDEAQKHVIVACPDEKRVAKKLKESASEFLHISQDMLAGSQFPDTVSPKISKPREWY